MDAQQIYYEGYQAGYKQCGYDNKISEIKPCSYCGGKYTVVDNEHNKYIADSEVKYCFHCGRVML